MAEIKPALREPGVSPTARGPAGVAPEAVKPPPLDLSQWNRKTAQDETDLHRVIVVGGGAAGLELATSLGDKLGQHKKAHITLIERTRTHFWKPHLHEIAAGSMDMGIYETNYLSHAHRHHFRYRIGEMVALDRERREVLVAPYIDDEGRQVTPPRRFSYDTLVIAIGSMTNDFGTPGAREYAISMETPAQAERFHRQLVDAFLRAHAQAEPIRAEQLEVAIIGAGATGVELAAELHNTTRTLVSYGFDRINPDEDIRITLIEAADRILPALPPRLSEGATALLHKLNINVRTSAKVSEVLPNGVKLANGEVILAELAVWAAGVKAPPVLQDLGGLESNRINQLVVLPTLQTTRDPNVFAIGDCAACPWAGKPGTSVPPRAQSAHQQASHMVNQIRNRLAGKPLTEFKYKDFGSLVSLGEHSTVGNLIGAGRNIWISGHFAKLMYLSLYKMHELALHGFLKVSLDTAGRFLSRSTEPHIKLH
jgi:NADH dehydrogenase